ncbi:acetylornithine deacetylase or succinyl- diaminopimelate desuccinylase [Thermanaerovibrio acidaminovorans DSM 6589]|uniref:Acetylornithine deacetylase or succinyl-diaminopimelate desuccinylase n=1 Tax=Thermanaerovibrio acidaminovorans (strain ATCC 49978 / DSM 6589 / Su883) TaxID=525903 RepID=D1B9C4_THEAS|nr:M20 family metallo-hydrolase [Thermanaerovibrio acidaminovorans]ACZ18877.1 acetylornithine deacetylase or succinyl- diaminopimelate desuccinylase [Thermanaerovibrio acidaminovorans DSM 6589]
MSRFCGDPLDDKVLAYEGAMVEALCGLVRRPAISPDDGGLGEYDKALYIESLVSSLGLGPVEMYGSPDPRAKGGVRPNLVLRVPGSYRDLPRLWIFTHMDVVPEGDRGLWESDPFEPVVRDGMVIGRGANDNGQELVASLFALKAVVDQGGPGREVCLAFVADEEVGSEHGIGFLMREHRDLFSPSDLVLVPDGGNEAGDFIEVAEKTILWVEFQVLGRQVHASRPDQGINACRVANELSVNLDRALRSAFPESDPLFEPAISTFEPTRRLQNVANVNTVPGREVFALDCRVLPHVPVSEVEKVIAAEVRKVEDAYGAKVSHRFLQKGDPTPVTDPASPVVELLTRSVQSVLGVSPRVGGIGGGTCAAFFRANGIPAAVWAQETDTAHMPGEYALVEHMLNEARVFARMFA